MVFPRRLFVDMVTSSQMLLCPLMVSSLSLDPGTELCVCGILALAPPPAASLDTPRMFLELPSPLTTVRLSLVQETRPSSYGTLWEYANTQSKKMDTLSGFLVYASHP